MAWHPMRGEPGTGTPGWVYLVALDEPVGHALHYRGWTEQDIGAIVGARHDGPTVARRLARHAGGTGARLLAVAKERGIGWTLVWAEPGDRHEERRLKNQGGRSARRDCTASTPAHAACGPRARRAC